MSESGPGAGSAGAAKSSRFPPFVYRDGEDPDPRFSLANERTFLAWMRTSLALAAAGVGLDFALASTDPSGGHPPSAAVLTLIAAAMFSAVIAWLRWARAERAIRVGESLPSPLGAAVLVVMVLVALVLSLVELWSL